MDFSWTESQRALREQIAEFASRKLNPDLIENDRREVFNLEGWKECGRFGIQGMCVPEEYGGSGLDPLTAAGGLERLGYACRDNGLIFSINAHMWTACMPLVAFGSEAQKRRWLPGLCDGTLIAGNAMTEPDYGSDAFGLRTLAEKRADRYIVTGSKTYVTNGPVADLLIVFATVDRSKGPNGITAFVVEKGAPGLTIAKRLEKMGLRTSPMAELFLENCEVSAENRLGAEGAGAGIFTHSMAWERSTILASAVGSMERLVEKCVRYARERRQGGIAIGKHQLVSNKIVDMKLRLETSRQLLYHTAWLRGRGRSAILEAAMTKLHISEGWVQSCEDALQIHGGYGYMTEGELERELRDALASRIYSGTSEIQRTIIASMLGVQ